MEIIQKLGINPGANWIQVMKNKEKTRINRPKKWFKKLRKTLRKEKNLVKRKLKDAYEKKEDAENPSYGAGMYWDMKNIKNSIQYFYL